MTKRLFRLFLSWHPPCTTSAAPAEPFIRNNKVIASDPDPKLCAQPLYSDQPDGWFATTLRIKEHPGVETREQRIASITEAGSDKPRPLIGKTERKSSAVAVARQPPDADPAPGFSDQPSGW